MFDLSLRQSKWASLHLCLLLAFLLPVSASAAPNVLDAPLIRRDATNSSIQPQAVYDGGLGGKEIRLRIGNGGAGQSGLIGAWANAFIQYCNTQGIAPFQVRLLVLTIV